MAALYTLDYIYPVFEEGYEQIEFDDISFHCIPHINDEDTNLEAIEQCENALDSSKHNIIMQVVSG